MSTPMFRFGTTIEVNGDDYQLLSQLSPGLWRVQEKRSGSVNIFTEQRLRTLVTHGACRPAEGFIPLRDILSGSLRVWMTGASAHHSQLTNHRSTNVVSVHVSAERTDTEHCNQVVAARDVTSK